MKNKALLTLVFIFTLLGLSLVSAAFTFSYHIDKVEVDGTEAWYGRPVDVERGQNLPITVWIEGFNNIDDVTVEAQIKGYEHGSIRDTYGPFKVHQNTIKKVDLVLKVPEDIDATDTYTLRIEVADKEDYYEQEYQVNVVEKRHYLNIQDVIFRPSNTVKAGNYLRAVVRVENLGAMKEEDIKVELSLPELGVSQRDYIDELVPEDNDDEETSQSSNEILVLIPSDAKSGEYEVDINVEYNRGHDVVSTTKKIFVDGTDEAQSDVETIISIDSRSKDVSQGSEAVFKLLFANLEDKNAVYSVEVAGTETWGNYVVEPELLSVTAGESGELLVKVKANEEASLGSKMFTLKVKSGSELIKEINLNAEITKNKSGIDWETTRKVLEIGFVVLVIILVILALIIAFKRVGNKEDEEEETADTEASYY